MRLTLNENLEVEKAKTETLREALTEVKENMRIFKEAHKGLQDRVREITGEEREYSNLNTPPGAILDDEENQADGTINVSDY